MTIYIYNRSCLLETRVIGIIALLKQNTCVIKKIIIINRVLKYWKLIGLLKQHVGYLKP